MCGIAAVLRQRDDESVIEHVKQKIKHRGPNHYNDIEVVVDGKERVFLAASVLHIQGETICEQPVVDPSGNILLWNGEVFSGVEYDLSQSDTLVLSELFSTKLSHLKDVIEISSGITTILAPVEGPFAFIYFHKSSNRFFFGRDAFGRRSLTVNTITNNQQQNQVVAISSVGINVNGLNIEEVDIRGIYCLDFESGRCSLTAEWRNVNKLQLTRSVDIELDKLQRHQSDRTCTSSNQREAVSRVFLEKLQAAVDRRVRRARFSRQKSDAAAVGVLFSGGIDSLLLAAILHRSLEKLSTGLAIELINIAFLQPGQAFRSISLPDEAGQRSAEEIAVLAADSLGDIAAPDRLAAIAGVAELRRLFPEREWRLVHVDVSAELMAAHETAIMQLIQPCNTHMDLNIGAAFYFAARGRGYLQSYSAEEVAGLTQQRVHDCDGEEDEQRPLLRRSHREAMQALGREECSEQREQSAGGELCQLDGAGRCQRAAKSKCKYRGCQRCCHRAHIQRVIASLVEKLSGAGERESDGAGQDEEVLLRKAIDVLLRADDRICQNDCPAHAAKKKHLETIIANISAQATQSLLQKLRAQEIDISRVREIASDCVAGQDQTDCSLQDLAPASLSAEAATDRLVRRGTSAYHAVCKVLLVGIGADEQLAGYLRHRTAFHKNAPYMTHVEREVEGHSSAVEEEERVEKFRALLLEMNTDLERLWRRNLGRDDRCIGEHGREGWLPYLDEQLVAYIQSLPVSQIADLDRGLGEGDKQILRDAARSLGLRAGADLVKRAIQFGSLAAKITSEKYYGSRRKGKGTSKINDEL